MRRPPETGQNETPLEPADWRETVRQMRGQDHPDAVRGSRDPRP